MPGHAKVVKTGLNVPQSQFLNLPHKYRAYVAGFGSGKTWVGCTGMLAHFYEHPKINQGYFAPTYPLIRDIFYPTIGEVAETMGLRVKVKKGDHEVEVYSGSRYRGSVICRSIDDPANIVGFKIGHALVGLITRPVDTKGAPRRVTHNNTRCHLSPIISPPRQQPPCPR